MGIPAHLQNHHLFAGGRWGAMSGEKPLYPAHFEAAHEKLVGVLKGMGLHHQETHGRYAEPERSVVIYSPNRQQMYHLGKMFGQESVVYSEGGRHELLYTNGEHDGKSRLVRPGAEPMEFFHEPPEDFYTRLPGHGYFRVNFDFDSPPQHLQDSGNGGMARVAEGLRGAAGGLQKSVAALPVQPALRPHPHGYDWHDGHTDHHRPTDPLSPVPGLRKDQQGHPHMDTPPAAVKPAEPNYFDQNAPVGVGSYHRFAAPYGHVNRGQQTNLLHYRYENKLPEIEELVKRHGYRTYYAGGKYGKPDLHARNYNTGHLMVYDPTSKGGDFGEEHYTRAWRQIHELSHALTYPELNGIYGEGRRLGKLGVHRTLNEAMRAVHWEWLAAHKQRELSKQVGVHLADDDFHRELNTVMHDALHRAVTGKFTEPSGEGFAPHPHKVDLSTAMDILREEGAKLGLRGQHDLLQRKSESENVIFFAPRTADMPDLKTYSPEEAASLLMKAAREKIAGFDAELRELRKRELEKAQKSLVPPHKHNTGVNVSAGIEDVAPGKMKGGVQKNAAMGYGSQPPPAPTPGIAKADLCKECGKEHLGKCGGIKAAKTEETPAEASPPEPDEYRCPECSKLTYGPGKCQECQKELGKAMVSDGPGRVRDTGVLPESVLPGDKPSEKIETDSQEGSGGVKPNTLKALQTAARKRSAPKTPASKPDPSTQDLPPVVEHQEQDALEPIAKASSDAGSGGQIRRGKTLKALRKGALKAEKQDAGKKCPKCGEDHKGVDHATAVLFGPEPKVLHPADKKPTKKAEPPMAKPPSGKNPGTHMPASKPAAAPIMKDVDRVVVPGKKESPKVPAGQRDYDVKVSAAGTTYSKKPEVKKALGDPNPGGGSRGGAPRPKLPKLRVGTAPAPAKPAAPAAPPQATGSAKIAAVGQQPLVPTSAPGLASPKAAGVAAKPGIFGRMAAKMGKAEMGARISPTLVPKPKLAPGVSSPYDTEGPHGTEKEIPKTVVARPSKMS